MVISTRRRERINWQSFTHNRTSKVGFIYTPISVNIIREFSGIIENNERMGQGSLKRLLSQHDWKHYFAEEAKLWQNESIIQIITKESPYREIEYLPEITYINRNATETLLGSQGKTVLERIINLVKDTTHEEKWPMIQVEIQVVKDPEITDSKHILLVFCFNADFDTANKYLHNYYDKLDNLIDTLKDEEQEILRKQIFFDVKTKDSISIG